ncbi:hypothetical protein JCM8547_001946 [Rhodosporidiobolus lusitaniae]
MSHTNYTSTGCPAHEVLPHDPVPFFSNGEITFKAHDVGWLVCGICTIVASSTSIWLICKHLSFFYHPHEQRHIVRLLFMPVIYAVCSFLSYFFYQQALYFQLLRDCYEALVIASFFFLLMSYLSNPVPTPDNPHPRPFKTKAERNAQLRSWFVGWHLDKWMWPLGRVKWRPAGGGEGEGEAFLWHCRFWIGQYVIIRPLSTFVAVLAQATGYYCLASWSPKFLHLWTMVAITLSVTVALYAVLQFPVALKEPLKPYRPMLKFLCVKLVVFFMFWQETGLSFLVTVGLIKSRTYWSAEEICIGIGALLACIEMVFFSFLHVKAFTYLPYRALAAPVSYNCPQLYADEDDEKIPLDPSKPLTFAEWDARDRRAKEREKALSRLAKPPKQTGDSSSPPTKADGTPLLQQTRKWSALLTCLNLLDVGRELVAEAKFVFRGGRLEEMEERLLDARSRDLEAVMGEKRGEVRRGRGEEVVREKETDVERDLRRLREGRAASRNVKVGADGSLLFNPARGVGRDEDQHALLPQPSLPPSRWAGWEDPSPVRREDSRHEGWWSSLKGGRRNGPRTVEEGTFQQVPRLDYAPLPVAGIPTLDPSSSSLPVPAAHHYDDFAPRPQQPRAFPFSSSPPRKRSSLDPPIPSSLVQSRKYPSNTSSEDSQGHLPRETLRPTSYARPPAKTPSPPPFSGFQSQSQPPLPSATGPPTFPSRRQPDDAFTALPSNRFRRSGDFSFGALPPPQPALSRLPSHAHTQSVPIAVSRPLAPPELSLTAPAPVLFMASAESRVSRGLPPGAGAPTR